MSYLIAFCQTSECGDHFVSDDKTKDRRKKCKKNKDGYTMLEYSTNKIKYLNATKNYWRRIRT